MIGKMRLLLLSDLHGRVPEIIEDDFDIVLCAGDIGDDSLLRDLFFKSLNGGSDFEEELSSELIVKHYVNIGRSYEKILKELKYLGKHLVLVPGNQDVVVNKYYKGLIHIVNEIEGVKMVHLSRVDLESLSIIGYGLNMAPEIPIHEIKNIPRRFHRHFKQYLLKKVKIFESLFNEADNPVIFLTHNMPFKVLDKIKAEWSGAYGLNFGSLVVKNILKRFRPMLIHGGHMHEYHDLEVVDGVICINSGYAREGKYCIVEVDKNKVKKVDFYENKNRLKEVNFS